MKGASRQIIGGQFGLHTPKSSIKTEKSIKFKLSQNKIYFINARSAMLAIFKTLKPSTIWYPSYLCPSMLRIPEAANIKHNFYPVNKYLKVNDIDWIDQVKLGDVIVLIDYFGFPICEKVVRLAKNNGAYIIEDASQALLSAHVGILSDYAVYSPRKFLGIPDGGILCYEGDVPPIVKPNLPPPPKYWIKAFNALLLRQQWDYGKPDVTKELWFNEKRKAGKEIPCGPYMTSTLSHSMLETDSFDWQNIREKRQENFNVLLGFFSKIALFNELKPDVVPLGFPIIVPSKIRDKILEGFFAQKIYPPVHWDIKNQIPSKFRESHLLSNEEITLPCDQRYDIEDMKKIAKVFDKVFNS